MRMARKEASLVFEGHRFVNQLLETAFPHRSLEAIKGQRRRDDYKEAVQRFLDELSNTSTRSDTPTRGNVSVGSENAADPDLDQDHQLSSIRSVLGALPPLRGSDYCVDRLNRIVGRISSISPSDLTGDISLYIWEIFPRSSRPAQRSRRSLDQPVALSRRKQRRADYARTQRMFRKDPGRCIGDLLENISHAGTIDRNLMEPFWTAVFETTPTLYQTNRDREPEISEALDPILPSEIPACFPKRGISPGPDLITSRALRAVPVEILARMFNIFLVSGELPEDLCRSVVTFLPKKLHPVSPSDFRPIAVSSVITRTF